MRIITFSRFEQIDQKLDELSAAGGVQILMQGGHHPKLAFEWYVDLLHHIREKYPHINIHGFSPPEFQHFAETFRMPLREVISRIQERGAWFDPRRRRRNSGRPRAAENFAAENQQRRMAGSDASRARAGIEIERDHDVRARRDDRRSNRAFADAFAINRTGAAGSRRLFAGRFSRSTRF